MYLKKLSAIALCIVFAIATTELYAQTRITGTVTDGGGEPVVGATVMVMGTLNGTQTNFEGQWELQIKNPESSTLLFTCLGYDNIEQSIGNRSVIDIVMNENIESLQETVVVGYGTQKKVNVTGAVTSVDFEELSKDRTIINVSSALAGTTPGMMVRATTGQPGSETSTIRIRGTGSFTSSASSPLVLLDGIEWDLQNVNPNDVESISVLKDAASTAIYGSRAANGVILITSKNGEESKPRISYSYNALWQTPYNNYEYVSDNADYMEFLNEGHINANSAAPFSTASINLWREKKAHPNELNEYGVPNYMAYPNTDWWDAIFDTGFSQEHQLSISGGSKTVRYLISSSYLDNEGIINKYNIDAGTETVTFRTNLEADVTKWFTIGTKIFAKYLSVGQADVSSIFSNVYMTIPGMWPGEPNKWGSTANSEDYGSAGNQLARAASQQGTDHRWRINTTLYAKIRPYKGISIEGTINYVPYFRIRHYYTAEAGRWDYTTNTQYSTSSLDTATVTDYTSRNYSANTEILARYDNTFKKDHTLGVLLGYSTIAYSSRSFSVQRRGATDWSMNDGSTYADLYNSSYSSESGWTMRSYFVRANYAYKDRYLFEGNFRADGSSVFGSANRYGFFPSFSAGWRIDQEPWMLNSSNWISQLKIRASWGETGNNQGIGNYSWQATYDTGNVVIDGSNATTLYIASQSNVDLKWETTATTDVGIDVGFFRNRLTAEMDYYHKDTRDILYTPSTYMTMGNFSAVPANLGRMWNQGVEIALNWKDTAGKYFFYYVGVNFSYNRNKVTKFKGKLEEGLVDGEFVSNFSDVAEAWSSPGYLVEGHEIGEHYIYQRYRGTGDYNGGILDINAGPVDGMIRTEADMAWVKAMINAGYKFNGVTTISKDQLWYGDFIYADTNGDGNYGNSYDRVFNGHSAVPKYNLGITLGFSWKGLDFSMIWSGAFDYYLNWMTTYVNDTIVQLGRSLNKDVGYDHYFYDPDNPSDPRTNIWGSHPRLYQGSKNDARSDYFEYKADYMKLKSVTLGYTIPEKWTRKAAISQLRFYVSGENLITITSYPGEDPEIGTSINYPLMRQYTVGAQITF